MRVTQVIPNFEIGGTQKAGCVLAEGLAESGHEAAVVGWGGGVRYVADTPERGAIHIIVETNDHDRQAQAVLDTEPDVIHIHGGSYKEPLLDALDRQIRQRDTSSRPLVVSTPVFGRPPRTPDILKKTKTCLIGVYMLYRMRKWMSLTARQMLNQGIGVVTINSFQLRNPHPSTLDPESQRQTRQQKYGVNPDAIVFGRLGRAVANKWHPHYPEVINAALTADPRLTWLSVGYPTERGLQDLQSRWGKRFVSLPETPDIDVLYEVLSCMDLQLFFSPWGECFSTTICEAASVGLPTISGVNPLRDNGQTEQIVEGVTGHLAATPSQAVEQLRELAENTVSLRKLQRSTYDYAHSRWTTPKVNDLLLEFYDTFHQARPADTPYGKRLIEADEQFSSSYVPRMLSLLGSSRLSRLRWQATLAAVADYRTFKIARRFKYWLR